MNTNRISTELKRIKDVLSEKIDKVDASITSVKNSVTNLPTTLDSKFSALTSKVDDVKTDVAGVGGKVDEAKTTLSSKIDRIKEDTELANAKITDVVSDFNALHPDKLIVKKIQKRESTGDVVTIKGKGKLHAVIVDSTDNKSGKFTVNIDGVSVLNIEVEQSNNGSDAYLCSAYRIVPSTEYEHYYYTPFGAMFNPDLTSCNFIENYDSLDSLVDGKYSFSNFYTSNRPLEFSESLVVNKYISGTGGGFTGVIVYSLDE